MGPCPALTVGGWWVGGARHAVASLSAGAAEIVMAHPVAVAVAAGGDAAEEEAVLPRDPGPLLPVRPPLPASSRLPPFLTHTLATSRRWKAMLAAVVALSDSR